MAATFDRRYMAGNENENAENTRKQEKSAPAPAVIEPTDRPASQTAARSVGKWKRDTGIEK